MAAQQRRKEGQAKWLPPGLRRRPVPWELLAEFHTGSWKCPGQALTYEPTHFQYHPRATHTPKGLALESQVTAAEKRSRAIASMVGEITLA